MRFHRHQVGRTSRWHSVRVRHQDVWDWCAHQEELERHLVWRRREATSVRTSRALKLEAAR
jgi:hypothetical protein